MLNNDFIFMHLHSKFFENKQLIPLYNTCLYFQDAYDYKKNHTFLKYGFCILGQLRNRFKGLDLIDRVPDELWTEVPDIVQETGIKIIPIENKCKKAKWLSEEALQIDVKRREANAKEKSKDISI